MLLQQENLIRDFALKYPSYGYRMITSKLKFEGQHFNHKKVYRIYTKTQIYTPSQQMIFEEKL
jgi:hypothetical protein